MNEREHSWQVGDTSKYDYLADTPMRQIKGEGIRKLEANLPREDIFKPKYKFNEDRLLADLRMYVDRTYTQHYAQNKFQATEFIIDSGLGLGFTLGNVMKYAQRYGKKDGYNRQDLMKVLHYALIALHIHDLTQAPKEGDR